MNKISAILTQPEGRKLEFKVELPVKAELVRTMVAFSNDAGGAVDFTHMEAGQSDIRNKALAPVFKKMGIIEQWGNGLRLISEELRKYPEIGFEWKEPGLAFRVAFIKKNYKPRIEIQQELQQESQQELQQELQHELQYESLFSKILNIIKFEPKSRKTISESLGQKAISGQLNEVLTRLQSAKLIEWTIQDKPKSSKQRYQITKRGHVFLQLLKMKT
jgi:ATP-dependent DNA helicase RecG